MLQNHNVYVLGAGFSHDAGYPLLSNFFERMLSARDELEGVVDDDVLAAIDAVFAMRQKATGAAYRVAIDLENIEDLFSFAAAGLPKNTVVIRKAISATLFACEREKIGQRKDWTLTTDRLALPILRRSATNHAEGVKLPISEYAFALATLTGQFTADSETPATNAFLSFNYDCLVEDSLKEVGLDWSYCLRKSSDTENAPLLKLHGSANWSQRKAGAPVEVHSSIFECLKAGRTPLLVPPTWQKTVRSALLPVWERARAELARATRIVIIGFSMPPTDLFFKYLLAVGLQENARLKSILFVNPDREGLTKRAEEMFSPLTMRRRVEFAEATLRAFVSLPGTSVASGVRASAVGRDAPRASLQRIMEPRRLA